MRCYMRLLNISYKDHVTNEEVSRKIQEAIEKYDELLALVKKRKLRWFGDVSRYFGLAKIILHGSVKGKRKRGRQKKRWEDNIKEWTGMGFASSTRAAENRTRWKGAPKSFQGYGIEWTMHCHQVHSMCAKFEKDQLKTVGGVYCTNSIFKCEKCTAN